ncbi:calcium-binding protein [Nostoc sp. LEGE 12447]|uniref:beta strand repeat-containing protein n=1 Tax=Nostoc sp. LEGE 12447 TaxID=1828640 RepID=UPI0018848DFE|nr:calcium-binding protein [Nostoc sp. LEGE 12447]MBE8998256.1 calcium-binding protein [Nostoc sp. LEGE 12447]
MSIIVGTPNNDFLVGTSGDDQISGRAGNDNISGDLGNDIIDGGEGNDTLAGNGGNDTFKGSRGDDSIDGGDGFDTADYSNLGTKITLSGVGTITKAGGFGTDTVFKVDRVIADATVANNTIDASQSLTGVAAVADLEAQTISALNVPGLGTLTFNVVNFDNVIGTNNDDTLKGDSQNNQLTGLAGNDLIDGRGGNDLIDGGDGNDTLFGGDGDDAFKGGQGNDNIDGGAGFDTADYSKLGKTITLSGVGTVIKAGGLGQDQLLKVDKVIADASVANNTIDASQSLSGVAAVADLEAQTISALNVPGLGTLTFNVVNFDNVIGTINDDTLKGDGQNNQLSGLAGNDLIDGKGGNDIIDGGEGSDTLFGGNGNDTFKGSQGNDNIDGGVGTDTADYSKLGQTITLSGVGTVTKAGGLGQDQLLNVEKIIADSTVANNTIDASASLAGVSITVNLQSQTLTANNVPGLGTLPFTVVNFDDVIGTNGDDFIAGDRQNNKLTGNGGNDTFRGSQGDDSINGGDGFDTADYSSLGKKITLSGVGTITKAGGFGKDTVFKVDRVIADASVANNTIDASQSLAGVAAVADLEAQTISALNVPGLGTLTFNVVNFANVIGTINNDSLKGDGQNNQLSGLAGNDLIDGRDGNDLIDGGDGNDTLIGGAGDDTFKGSRGNDSINGGDGLDTADYSKLGKAITLSGVGQITKAGGFGTDTVFKVETVIADASVANNTIDSSQSVAGVSVIANLQEQTISALNVPSLGTITFNVLNFDNLIGTNASDSITGDSQNNRLEGRDGNDTISGGFGNDTIIGEQGNDILTGGFGADKFIFNSLSDAIDIIKDYTFGQSDVIQVSKAGFGTTNSGDFTYDNSSGNLSFLGNQFAFIENLSSNVSIQLV